MTPVVSDNAIIDAAVEAGYGIVHPRETPPTHEMRRALSFGRKVLALGGSADMPGVQVSAYSLPDGAKIESCSQRDGGLKWAVRRLGECLAHDGSWEAEPAPSARSDDFLARCRFDGPKTAYAAWKQARQGAGVAG